MGDATPARATEGTAHGEGAAPATPDVLDARQEAKFAAGWARDALDALRGDFGATHAFGMGRDNMFWAWRLDGTTTPMRSPRQDGLRRLVGTDLHPVRWCTACKEPVRPDGHGAPPGTGVHIGAGPHDHPPAVTDEDPVLRAEADALERDYPEVTVSVRFRVFRADYRAEPGKVRPHFEAGSEADMRRQLAAATRRPAP